MKVVVICDHNKEKDGGSSFMTDYYGDKMTPEIAETIINYLLEYTKGINRIFFKS